MKNRSWKWLALLLIVTLAAAGCGGASSDEAKIESTITTYFRSLADGNGDQACQQLTGNAQRELIALLDRELPEIASFDCAEVVSRLTGAIGPDEVAGLRAAKVTDVQVNGDHATASIEGATVSPTLVRFEDGWLIQSGFSSP